MTSHEPSDPFLEDFNRCWPWLEAAIAVFAFEHDGKIWPTHRKEDILKGIQNGHFFFWPGKKCAILTQVRTSPTGLKTHITWATGGIPNESLDEVKELTALIEWWGRNQGCHRQSGHGRPGWSRVLGYESRGGINKYKNLLVP